MSVDEESVRAALNRVLDPCSVAAGRPTGLADMGLLDGWSLQGGILEVAFRPTFTGCTMAPHFMQAAAGEVARLPGVERVETRLAADALWTPDRMAPHARGAAVRPAGVTPWAAREMPGGSSSRLSPS